MIKESVDERIESFLDRKTKKYPEIESAAKLVFRT
jgi:hypothetical protein